MMSESLFFSIIIPVYNAQDTLKRCIDSILRQSCQSFEILLIDDGSVDDSASICDEYSRIDNRITVVHKANSGEFFARKTGIDLASGKYITGVDADDYYEDDYLETIYNYLSDEKYDIVMWSLTQFGDWSNKVKIPKDYIGEHGRDDLLKIILESTLHSFVLKAFRTELLKKIDYSGVPDIRFSADYCLTIPAVIASNNGIVIDYYGYMYYIHQESQSHSVDYSKLMDLCKASEYGLGLLEKNGLNNDDFRYREHVGFLKVFFDRMMIALKHDLLSREQIDTILTHRAYMEAEDAEKVELFGENTYNKMKLLRNGKLYELIRGM